MATRKRKTSNKGKPHTFGGDWTSTKLKILAKYLKAYTTALNLRSIDWVIVGGESVPSARPMDGKWVTEIRDQCSDAQGAWDETPAVSRESRPLRVDR